MVQLLAAVAVQQVAGLQQMVVLEVEELIIIIPEDQVTLEDILQQKVIMVEMAT